MTSVSMATMKDMTDLLGDTRSPTVAVEAVT